MKVTNLHVETVDVREYLYGLGVAFLISINLVISEVLKKIANLKINHRLYYYRDNNGNEVDLIIDRGSKQIGIEIKAGQTYKSDFLKGLDFWRNLDEQQHDQSILLYAGSIEQKLGQHQVLNWAEYVL
ncbi:DUF4143 domain-containing protein [Patescibacteria group bacterium]|nr:DUF4143 domain-containing protein [Patescibacteria group bacterium]